MTLTYLSLFSGVGGGDLGFEAAGLTCVAQVEWDVKARSVLEHHWPDIPKYGDVRDYHGSTHPADVIFGGFPCQDVSIAGKRQGIGEGTRSGLYAEIIRIVKEMQHATNGTFPRWVVLENVRGILSLDKGAGFQQVIDDLADMGALVIEYGMVDTQFFGPPQRRQRIFVVACLDPATASHCPNPLLPLSESRPRNPDQGRTTRPINPPRTPDSTVAGSVAGLGIAAPLLSNAQGGNRTSDIDGATWVVQPPTGNERPVIGFNWANGRGYGNANPGLGITEDGIGPLTTSQVPAVAIPAQGNWTAPATIEPAPTGLVTQTAQSDIINTVASKWAKGSGGPSGDECQNIIVETTYAINENQKADVYETEVTQAVNTGGGKPGQGHIAVRTGATVRRITPLEAERLQGWPDNWTHTSSIGPQADTVRYKQIGNGISAPVAKWIAQQLLRAEHHAP